MEQSLQEILRNYFGFEAFRPLQQEIIKAVVEGKDVLALMPTGGGKSLCYQVPGLYKKGLCLVVSPLIALMNDQVQDLRKKNITAYAIHSGLSRKDVINVLETASHSNCKFLYVSPERLETSLFKEYLPALDINLIAVDEAHCISQWGYDFRPPYLRIASLREELHSIPVIALTASATPLVQQDICDKLSLNSENKFEIFRQSYERPNLSFSVFREPSRMPKIASILNNVQGSAIVYCRTRKRTREIASLLNARGIDSRFYHAGLGPEERSRIQDDWLAGRLRVIVSTNAFGMGINKPDVRVVIHADVPDSLENYYQEAGRAGRDGKRSFAVLLYNQDDLDMLETLPATRYPSVEKLREVYRSVVHYLQLPEGEAPGEYYDFDLKDFVRKFGLDINTTIYGLKALEQDGWLSFNEQIFLPATVRFDVYKDALYEYEKIYTGYEPLIKTLLRSYEGIYDYPVNISETYLAGLLHYDLDIVKEQLRKLHADGIIRYEPQKDVPQIMLNRPRIKSELLQIDTKNYAERKRVFTERVRAMQLYINNTSTCRSKIIGTYFGDTDLQDCGICDNCLERKKTALNTSQFKKMAGLFQEKLSTPVTLFHLYKDMQEFDKDHLRTVINFLVEEEKIRMLNDGRLVWVK